MTFTPKLFPLNFEKLPILVHVGDHFYKENVSLPLEQQMISALPDVESRQLEAGDEFIVIACDGIWSVNVWVCHALDACTNETTNRRDLLSKGGSWLADVHDPLFQPKNLHEKS